MKKINRTAFYGLILLASIGFLYSSEEPGERFIEDKQAEVQKEREDLAAQQEEIARQEREKEDEIKAKESSGQISDADAQDQIAQNKADADQQIAQFKKQDTGLGDEITVLNQEKIVLDQAQAAGDVARNLAAEKVKIQQNIQISIDKTAQNLQSIAHDGFSEITNNCAFSIKELSDLKNSFNESFDQSQLLPDQADAVIKLNIQADAMITSVHAEAVNRINTVIADNLVVTKEVALKAFREVINSVYGLDIPLGASITTEQQKFYDEGASLLNIFEGVDGTITDAAYADKIFAFKTELYNLSENLLSDVDSAYFSMEDQIGSQVYNDINAELRIDSNYLKNVINTYEPDLAANNFGLMQENSSDILVSVKEALLNIKDAARISGGYNKLAPAALKGARADIDYSSYLLQSSADGISEKIAYLEAQKTDSQTPDSQEILDLKSALDELNKTNNELLEEKLKADTAELVTIKGVSSLVNDYNANAIQTTSSLVGRIFNKVLDTFNTLFKKIGIGTLSTPTNLFADQVNTVARGVSSMQSVQKSFAATCQALSNSASALYDSPIPNFSQDRTPVTRISDPKYRTLKNNVAVAEKMITDLQAQNASLQAARNASNDVSKACGTTRLLVSVSVNLKTLTPEFLKDDGTLDNNALIDRFEIVNPAYLTPKQLQEMGTAQFNQGTDTTSNLSSVGNIPVDQLQQAGLDIFNALQGKQFFDLTFNEVTALANYYKIEQAAINGGQPSRNFTYLLGKGGEIFWEQVKSLSKGQPDYGQANPSLSDSLSYLDRIIKASSDVATILGDLGTRVIDPAIYGLQSWLDEANQALGSASDTASGTGTISVQPQVRFEASQNIY